MSKADYHGTRLGAIVKLVMSIAKAEPRTLDDYDYMRSMLKEAMPELGRRDVCPNCEASMLEYIFHFDAWDALLLMKMGAVVKEKLDQGLEFTIANQVRIPELNASHAIKCRTTQSSKLGLIVQLKNEGGKRVGGVWVITRRGWQALAGKPVPESVRVFRGRIEERFEKTITLREALQSHITNVRRTIQKGRTPKQDYRVDAEGYNPRDWVEFGPRSEPNL